MAPAKKKVAATPPKNTGIHGFSPTKSGTKKVVKVTPTKPTKAKKTGLHSLRDIYTKVMADAPYKTSAANMGEEEEDEDYSPGKEDEGQEDDDDGEDRDEDHEAEESSGTESEGEGEGEKLIAEQKRIKAELDLDPRYETNRKRALKKHRHIVARIEEDGQEWKNKSDKDLGDIIKDDKGGRFRLVEDKAGSVVQQPGGIYYDTKTNQSFKKVRKFKEKSALPYGDGEIPVKAMKMKDGAAGE